MAAPVSLLDAENAASEKDRDEAHAMAGVFLANVSPIEGAAAAATADVHGRSPFLKKPQDCGHD